MKAYPDIQLDFKMAPKTEAPVYLHEKVSVLDINPIGPYVRNKQSHIVCIESHQALISEDEGHTWQAYDLFSSKDFLIHDTRSLCVSDSGVIVVGFLNMAQAHFKWHKKANKPTQNTRLDLWSVRSLDGGKTWEAPVRVQKGYCGSTTTMISLSSGKLLMAAQNLDYEAGRHYSLTYLSEDEGQTWQASNKIDIGGQGHHGGCYEGTLLELKDGRVWYLIRTNLDWFWNGYSDNEGLTWTHLEPGMTASSSPGMLCRLQSGRLLLAYNQLTKEGETTAPRIAGLFSDVPASWQREELSIRLSDDDGKSWTDPMVIASCKGAWLSYCSLFEVKTGEIWLTTMQSQLKLKLKESDFI